MVKPFLNNLKKGTVPKIKIFFLILILALACFFRFYKLSLIPPGLYPDEAVNGTDAISVLETGKFQVFYPSNNGREGLFINLLALSFGLFGISIWSLKLVSAMIGVLTILGLYLLSSELFNKKIALLSSFLLACSFWHVNFSRIGFRAILVPFVLVYLFYFLALGFRFVAGAYYIKNRFKPNIFCFAWAGLFFGLGFYTYIAFRVVPLILLALFFRFWFCKRKKEVKTFWKGLSLFLVIGLIVALPLIIYFINNPQDIFGRIGGISVFAQPSPKKALLESILKTLGMFNFKGDLNWRHNYSGSPMLFWPVGILFLAGFVLAMIRAWSKSPSLSQRESYLLLIFWFFLMLLPAVFSYEGLPHALRTIGVLPAVYLLAALPLEQVLEIKRTKLFITILVLIFLIFVALFNFQKYFIKWAEREEVKNAFRQDLVQLGKYLNDLPLDVKRYIIVNEPGVLVEGTPVCAQTIKFVTYKKSENIYLAFLDLEKIEVQPKTLVIFLNYDLNLVKQLYSVFPFTNMQKINNFYGFSNF